MKIFHDVPWFGTSSIYLCSKTKGKMENQVLKKIDDQALCELAFLLGKQMGSEAIKESVRETAEETACFSF